MAQSIRAGYIPLPVHKKILSVTAFVRIQEEAEERFNLLVEQMAERESVTFVMLFYP